MDNRKDQNEHCICNAKPLSNDRVDITKTTACPYCGMRFESSREVLVHVFHFHSG